MRLARMCLTELTSEAGILQGASAQFWQRTGVAAVTRPLDPELFPMVDDTDLTSHVRDAFVRPLCETTGLLIPLENVLLIPEGPVGSAKAIAALSMRLERGELERFVLIAVDSWFDPVLIERASGTRRLKSTNQPVGFVPGEAAACLLLETLDTARRRNVLVKGLLDGIGVAVEPGGPIDESQTAGQGLAEAFGVVLTDAKDGFGGDVVADLNGELWRAQQWGHALVKLGPSLARARVHLPCISIGDTGAASGAVGICLATEAFRRGWAAMDSIAVVSNSDSGESACVRVNRASQ
jgi:3-oxoacyl-[acyl-carrier-protein] synthase-1